MSTNSNVSKTSLVWLDNSSNEIEIDRGTEEQFRLLNSNFTRFRSEDEWNNYLKSQNEEISIILIISGALGKQLAPQLQTSPKVSAIYIYCSNKEVHEAWSKDYDKVKGVYVDVSLLIKALKSNSSTTTAAITTVNTKKSIVTAVFESEPILVPASAPASEENQPAPTPAPEENPPVSEKNQPILPSTTYRPDIAYIILDSCFEFISRIRMPCQAKTDFCTFYRNVTAENTQAADFIKHFEDSYEADQAAKWLLENPFIRSLVENSFNILSIDSLVVCRMFITDIQNQLQKHPCDSTIQVYRCEIMPNEQFQRLKDSKVGITAIKYFFLANTDRTKALESASEVCSNNDKRVLFTIEANPQTPGIKPFAKVASPDSPNDLNNVLFMIGSLFKITEIEETNELINVKMTLCAFDETNRTKQLCDQIKNKYIDPNGGTDYIEFARFLSEFGKESCEKSLSNCGEEMLRSCLGEIPENDFNRYRCYDGLGSIELARENYDQSLDYYTKSLELKKQKFEGKDVCFLESYHNLGQVYMKKKQWTEALNCFEQCSQLLKHYLGEDCFDLICCYTNMALVHEKTANYKEELSYYYRSLVIINKHNVDDDAGYAVLYSNIGVVYNNLGEYHLALGFFQTALQKKLKIYSEINPQVAATYKNIAFVCYQLNDIPQARTNYERAARICRQFYSAEDPSVKEIEETLRNLPVHS